MDRPWPVDRSAVACWPRSSTTGGARPAARRRTDHATQARPRATIRSRGRRRSPHAAGQPVAAPSGDRAVDDESAPLPCSSGTSSCRRRPPGGFGVEHWRERHHRRGQAEAAATSTAADGRPTSLGEVRSSSWCSNRGAISSSPCGKAYPHLHAGGTRAPPRGAPAPSAPSGRCRARPPSSSPRPTLCRLDEPRLSRWQDSRRPTAR